MPMTDKQRKAANNEAQRRYRKSHPEVAEKHRKQANAYYHANKHRPEFKAKLKANRLARAQALPDYNREKGQKYRDSLRAEVIAAYGGQCNCCGEAEPRFMTIDHIHNDGGKHRREVKRGGGHDFYSMLKKEGFPQDRYQMLCWNCNGGKRMNKGVCPHKKALF